jgi:hypothetical protein
MNGGWTLKIFATAESGGDYRCTATTPYGESLSHTIHVSVFGTFYELNLTIHAYIHDNKCNHM